MTKMTVVFTIIFLFMFGRVNVNAQLSPEKKHSKIKVLKIDGDYTNVYKPADDIFPGSSVGELVAGKRNEEWAPNDHCFIKDSSGRWRAFGNMLSIRFSILIPIKKPCFLCKPSLIKSYKALWKRFPCQYCPDNEFQFHNVKCTYRSNL